MTTPSLSGVSLKSCLRHALPTLAVLAAWRWARAPDADPAGPLVRVEQGVLLGAHRFTHRDAIPYFSFQGVPYARPPVGELRFKSPLPPDNWTDVRPALEEGPMCCQPHTEIYWMPPEIHKMFLPSLRRAWLIVSSLPRLWSQIRRFWAQQEDCLYLNVYTKQVPAPDASPEDVKLSPVVVFIHGGAFYTGTANSHIYGPDYLLREDLVLVTVQYRLGALGFLAPGSREVPGNAGLKDQAAALRWVQRNIARLGGDPGRVTLLGHSAGGASVHYHTLSAASRGLFHRAVHLSGCALNAWAFAPADEARRRALRLARLLGCPEDRCRADDGDSVLGFLRTQSPRDMIDASYKVFQEQETAAGYIAPFVPTVDGAVWASSGDAGANGTNGDVFLKAHPAEAMLSGDYWPVPTLVGQNSLEGMIVLMPDIITEDMTPSERNLAALEASFEHVVPRDLGLTRGSAAAQRVATMMRQHYFAGRPVSGETTLNFVQIYSDLLFSIGLGRYMRALHKLSPQPVYFYQFSFDGRLSVVKKLTRSELPGVSHGDELGYLFPVEMLPPEDVREGDVELLVRDRWTRLVANFAKFGSPNGPQSAVDPVLNVSWTPSTDDAPRYVDIGQEMTLHEGYPLSDTYRFWEKVFKAVEVDIAVG